VSCVIVDGSMEGWTHVVLPCLFLAEIKFNTGIIWLVRTRELNTRGRDVTVPKNLDIEAVSVELRTTVACW
jgi:hypothetical protein